MTRRPLDYETPRPPAPPHEDRYEKLWRNATTAICLTIMMTVPAVLWLQMPNAIPPAVPAASRPSNISLASPNVTRTPHR